MHPAGVVGPTSVPQVLPPLLPPLLPLPPLLVDPPLLLLPPLLPPLPVPIPQTPPRGTHALTCCPELVVSGTHASELLHDAPPAHDAAQ